MIHEPFFVLVHNIRSLHNVGSIFRTADCFGVTKLFLTGYTGHPPDPKLAKVALGAEQVVPWEYIKSVKVALKKIRKEYPNIHVIGLENNLPSTKQKHKKLLQNFKAKFPLVLVVGEEVGGLGKSLLAECDTFVEIPQFGHKESLNVSVAFGVAAYAVTSAK